MKKHGWFFILFFPLCFGTHKLKDRITPQVNFLQKSARNVVAGTGNQGKTKEVVEVVCDKVACESWCVTKKDGVCVCVWQSYVWKMAWLTATLNLLYRERWCVTKLCVKDSVWQRWCVKDVCDKEAAPGDACHAERKWMFPSATPATQNQGGCDQVQLLPRETKVDVAKCHACHAKRR